MTDSMFTGMYRGKNKHINDLKDVLERAKASHVEKIIVTAGTLSETKEALNLARSHSNLNNSPELYSTVGVHPTRCGEFEAENGPDAYYQELEAVCIDGMKDGKVVAIGECGLDYERLEFCSKELQLKYFEKQFDLAEKTKLPMFLHNRNTGGDFYAMVAKHRHRFTHGVVHSFDGSRDEAKQLLELDLYIGVNGCSLKTIDNLETVRMIPTERLMIETDAPWCDIRATHAGFSHVKTTWATKKAEKYEPGCLVKSRNEPCTLLQVLEIVSAIRNENQNELAAAIYANTIRVFFPNATT